MGAPASTERPPLWFALTHLLDYPDVRVYYVSWVEWGKESGTPIEPNDAEVDRLGLPQARFAAANTSVL